MAVNYTEEQTTYITAKYLENPSRETVDKLAEELGKSPKSIIGKLSREKVYRREVYKTKQNETPITKVELVAIIAGYIGVEKEQLEGLEKTPKQVLKLMEKKLEVL